MLPPDSHADLPEWYVTSGTIRPVISSVGWLVLRNSIHNFAIIAWVFGLIVVAPMARADSGPVIVIPSRPGIPIIINGRDASYAVVEGDWGLSRPGHVAVTVIGASPVAPNEVYSRRNSYHPKYGSAPQRGRREIPPCGCRLEPFT